MLKSTFPVNIIPIHEYINRENLRKNTHILGWRVVVGISPGRQRGIYKDTRLFDTVEGARGREFPKCDAAVVSVKTLASIKEHHYIKHSTGHGPMERSGKGNFFCKGLLGTHVHAQAHTNSVLLYKVLFIVNCSIVYF